MRSARPVRSTRLSRPIINAGRVATALGPAIALCGCFYPSLSSPPSPAQNRIILALPYDLAWDAVNTVIKQNRYALRAQDPIHGVIEAQGTSFTAQDADCGESRSLGGRTPVEPTSDSSAEYNFHLTADGPESCRVEVEAVFITPVVIAFHPASDVQCVSRGIEEARLLKQIKAQAASMRRPTYKLPDNSIPHRLSR
jgi:hypothetical protein